MKLKTLLAFTASLFAVLSLTNCKKLDGVVQPLSAADSAATTLTTIDTGYYQYIAADKSESLYALIYGTRSIYKTDSSGVKTTFYTLSAAADTTSKLKCLTIDTVGNVYTISYKSGTSSVVKVNTAGVGATYIANLDQYTTNGAAEIDKIEIAPSGDIYFNDRGGIHKVTLNGTASLVKSGQVQSFTIDADGNVIFIILPMDSQLGKVTPAGVESVFAGSTEYGSANGPLNTATFNIMDLLAADKSGNVFVSEHQGFTNQIRVISATGLVSTLTSGEKQYVNLVTDAKGNLYFTEMATNGHSITRKISRN